MSENNVKYRLLSKLHLLEHLRTWTKLVHMPRRFFKFVDKTEFITVKDTALNSQIVKELVE